MNSIATAEAHGTITQDATMWKTGVQLVSDALFRLNASEHHARLSAGTAIALQPARVRQDAEGLWWVQSDNESGWYKVNGLCLCKDAEHRAPEQKCKHFWAREIVAHAQKLTPAILAMSPEEFFEAYSVALTRLVPRDQVPLLVQDEVDAQGWPPEEPLASTPEDADVLRIPPSYVQMIQGKPHVLYKGLLAMAHDKGLQRLEAGFISVTSELALAWATATFADGRVFTEAGDASPQNVGPKIKPHMARMALTRAKARALRDALDIGVATVEELD